MRRKVQRYYWLLLVLTLGAAAVSSAQQPAQPPAPPSAQSWTWESVKERFVQNNPTLLADMLNIDESRAKEITAFLRPNPDLGLLSDQITPFNVGPSHGALAYLLPSATMSYLYEREHKRDLRLESAQKATAIAVSTHGGCGENPAFQPAQRLCVDSCRPRRYCSSRKTISAYYDHVLDIEPGTIQGGRHRANRSRPAGAAARAV